MAPFTKSGSFAWAGGGKPGALVDLWAASRFSSIPAQNDPAPGGSPDAGPVTTGPDFGSPGAYEITGIAVEQDYYIRVQYGGQVFWGFCPQFTLGGATGGGGGGPDPATTVVGPGSFGASPIVGTGLNYAREDHWHGLPTPAGGGGPTGPAGGDLGGTYPDPSVVQLQGEPISGTTPTSGQILTFTGGNWTPSTAAVPPNPASTVTGPSGFGTSPVVGTATTYARADHSHGVVTFPGTAQLAPVDVVWGIDPLNQPVAIPLSGPMTIDGVSVTSGMRVLIPHYDNISGPNLNDGIWEVQAGAWTRPTDFPHGGVFTQAFVMVLGGTYRGGTLWACTSETNITIDTDPQLWGNLAHQGDPGHVYMSDFLEVLDFDNPYTDPYIARGNAEDSLPVRTWWHASAELATRHGVIDWGETDLGNDSPLVVGWTAVNTGGINNPNKTAKDGCLGSVTGDGCGVRDVGLGAGLTKLYSAFPKVFAQIVAGGGGTGFGPVWLRTPGGFDHMTLDGSFSPCGTGYMMNAVEFQKTEDLNVFNFGPTSAPGVAAVTVGGSTLQAGGWEVICTTSGSLSTAGWVGTGYQGWADAGGGFAPGYTAGPTESQPSAGQQIITTAGQGIVVTPPDQVASPPWGRNYYMRPVCQILTTSHGTTPAVNAFTGLGGDTITVNSATPLTGFPTLGGSLYVHATNSSGEACLAAMTYSGAAGAVLSGVNFTQLGSTCGGGALLAVGNVLYNSQSQYQRIATNHLDGTQPTMTSFTVSTAWTTTNVAPDLPSSLGFLGTGLYICAGNTAPSGYQKFSEKLDLNVHLEGNGNAVLFDGGETSVTGHLTSFEYSRFVLKIDCPPGMNGIVCTNSAWLNNCWWWVGSNYYPSFDAGGYWGNIMGTNTSVNQITYNTTLGFIVAGGGNTVQITLGAVIPNGSWFQHDEQGTPSGASGGAWVAGWLQQAKTDSTPFLIDAGLNYGAGDASTFCDMAGDMYFITGGGDVGFSKALPVAGLGQVNIASAGPPVLVNTGGSSNPDSSGLIFAPTSATNGCFSFNGRTNDVTLIHIAHTYSSSKNPDNSTGPSFVRL